MSRHAARAFVVAGAVALSAVLVVAGCGGSHDESSPIDEWRSVTTSPAPTTASSTTTTVSARALVVVPDSAPQSATFEFRLTGALPGDRISFQVRSPKGIFTGRAHEVPSTGTVTATYKTNIAGNTGRFTVIALGNGREVGRSSFDVVPTPKNR